MSDAMYNERWGAVNRQRYFNLREHWSSPDEPIRQPISAKVYMGVNQVAMYIGVTPNTIRRLADKKSSVYDPTFPRPKKITQRSIVFVESEIIAWMESRPYVHD